MSEKMTDLEITRLCAEAMGYVTAPIRSPEGEEWIAAALSYGNPWARYDPLHDDAQAMALVKKFGLNLTHHYWDAPSVEKIDAHGKTIAVGRGPDLNRAICEAVAKIQKAR